MTINNYLNTEKQNSTKLMNNDNSNIDYLFDNENKEEYELTPKGIAVIAMLQTGLIRNIDDPRINGFWTIFEKEMIERGYVEYE